MIDLAFITEKKIVTPEPGKLTKAEERFIF